jgi:hypothetical protein
VRHIINSLSAACTFRHVCIFYSSSIRSETRLNQLRMPKRKNSKQKKYIINKTKYINEQNAQEAGCHDTSRMVT